MTKYRISYFEQSLSKLYVRSVNKNDDGHFECIVFWGVKEIHLPIHFSSDGQIEASPCDDETHQRFEFVGSGGAYVIAVSYTEGFCRDFPEVDRVEMVEA